MPNEFPLSVWPVAQEQSATQRKGRYCKESTAHPGKMMPALARKAIEDYTQPGDWVLDPMCGIGTSLVEAVHLGRNAFGVEYEQRWAELAEQNIALARSQGAAGAATAACGDGRDVASLVDPTLVGRFALVLTSPPYGPSLHGRVTLTDNGIDSFNDHYSRNRRNLEYASTDSLLDAFAEILRSSAELLRPGGVAVITTRPWRRSGRLVDLPGAVVRMAASVGLEPFERNVALLCGLRDDTLIPRPSFFQLDWVRKARTKGIPLNVISHEDVIVLRKAGEAS